MLAYIFIFIFLSICSIYGKKNPILFIMVFLIMLFVAGFRDISVGTDTQHYYEIYEYFRLETFPSWFTIEPAWKIINNLAVKMHAGYSMVVFGASLCTLVPIFSTIWKYSDRPFVSVLFFYLLYFYFLSFNVARQMIAIAIVFSGYNDYLHEKKKAYYIQILIAVLFHYSAIIGLAIPFILKYVRLEVEKTILILPLTYFLGIVLIPNIVEYIPVVGKYSKYLLGDATVSFSIPRLLINCLCLLFISTSCKNDSLLKLFYVGIICYNLFAFSDTIGRCALYFMSSQMILFTNFQSLHVGNKTILSVVALIYGLVYVSVLLINNNGEVLPYSNHILSNLS